MNKRFMGHIVRLRASGLTPNRVVLLSCQQKRTAKKHMKLAYRTVKAKEAVKEVEAEIEVEIGEEIVADTE